MHQGIFLIMVGVVSSRMFFVGATLAGGAYPANAGHTMQAQAPTLLDGSCSSFCCMESVHQMTCLVMGLVGFLIPFLVLSSALPRHHIDTGVSLVDLMLQTIDTVSLGMSSQINEPPMGLLTHLQSHSWELIEAGAGNSKSVICENKI